MDKQDSVYYGLTEVSNAEYIRFLEDIKTTQPDLYAICKTDEDVFRQLDVMPYMEPFARNYFTHVAYSEYPVCCITHEGAVAYCNWLTSKVKPEAGIVFRLPTEEEYQKLLRTVNIKYDSDDADDYETYPINMRYLDNYPADGGLLFTFVRHTGEYNKLARQFRQNAFGMYHIIGNAAELMASGNTLGGSWASLPSEATTLQTPTLPSAEVGFRVLAVKNSTKIN